jgi:hypothetical protein
VLRHIRTSELKENDDISLCEERLIVAKVVSVITLLVARSNNLWPEMAVLSHWL